MLAYPQKVAIRGINYFATSRACLGSPKPAHWSIPGGHLWVSTMRRRSSSSFPACSAFVCLIRPLESLGDKDTKLPPVPPPSLPAMQSPAPPYSAQATWFAPLDFRCTLACKRCGENEPGISRSRLCVIGSQHAPRCGVPARLVV